jgi:transcription antitermination factor NusG
MCQNTSTGQWFALQVKARQEQLAATILSNKGYELFLPVEQNPGSRRKSIAPLFPGYLFCRFGMDIVGPVVTTPGVVRIVGIGNKPVAVDECEIDKIRRIQESRTAAEPCCFQGTGQRIVICGGPLGGIEGTLVSHQGADWLIVSITLLQRSIRVRLHAHSVRTLPGEARAPVGDGLCGN